MKELKELYNELAKDLRTEHELWVKSNFKLNSIHAAKQQIKTVGDISCNPAIEILTEAQERERRWNDDVTAKMYAHKELISKIERFARDRGEDWNETHNIFGY